MDGASSFKTFWKVILPICKPGLATAFIFTLFLAWNDFLVALLLTSTNAKTFTVGLAGFYQHTIWIWDRCVQAHFCLVFR